MEKNHTTKTTAKTAPVKKETPAKTAAAKPAAKPAAKSAAKPAAKPTAKPTVKPVAKAAKPAAKKEVKKEQPASFRDGKWVVSKSETGRYTFELFASNGEMMIFSGKEYSSLTSAKSGIETYKNAMKNGYFTVTQTKAGVWIFRLFNDRHTLLATSSNYTSESNCQNAVESTKNFAKTAILEVIDKKETK